MKPQEILYTDMYFSNKAGASALPYVCWVGITLRQIL